MIFFHSAHFKFQCMLTYHVKINILVGIILLSVLLVLFLPPIPQSELYHHFADDRQVFGLPHFYNVISNMPFILFGSMGVFLSLQNKMNILEPKTFFFFGILLTGFGSAYYHEHPTTNRLVWDRLPMTISFMSFVCMIIGEFIRKDLGKKLVVHFIFIGILSVLYWYFGESRGKGDLRFYALIQFLPMVCIPFILFFFKNQNQNVRSFWLIVIIYALAKLCEDQDLIIYQYTNGTISGHCLKHLIAGVVPMLMLFQLSKH